MDFHLTALILYFVIFPAFSKRSRDHLFDRLNKDLNSASDFGLFISSVFTKLHKEASCTTFVWDEEMSNKLEDFTFCKDQEPSCIYRPKYMLRYEGGNISLQLSKGLSIGYKERCTNYILLLSDVINVLELLRQGQYLSILNTRGRFLIWYGKVDRQFETDEIWKAIPNVVLFHSKLKRRSSKKQITVAMKTFKWPILEDVVERTSILEFWRDGIFSSKGDAKWYWDKTVDLKNLPLRVLVIEHPPGVFLLHHHNSSKYTGVEMQLISELSRIMNFRVDIVEMDEDLKWGGKVEENKTVQFFGAMDLLLKGDVDLAIGSFFILREYLPYIEMSVPIDITCVSFLTPRPDRRPKYLALIFPFQGKLWLLLFFIIIIFAPLSLNLLGKLKFMKSEYSMFTERKETILTSISIMSQVALNKWPKSWTFRLLIGWYWLFCLLIALAYKGGMVAFLSIPLFQPAINNLKQLAASNLEVGGWGPELCKMFTQVETTPDEATAKELLFQKYKIIDNLDESIERISDGKFALFENVKFLKFVRKTRHLSDNGAPTMRVMKQCVAPVHTGVAYPKHSPITDIINKYIRKFQEAGLMIRWSRKLVSVAKRADSEEKEPEDEKDEDPDDSEGSDDPNAGKARVLGTEDLQGAIYVIIIGFTTATSVFISEVFTSKTKKIIQVNTDATNSKSKRPLHSFLP